MSGKPLWQADDITRVVCGHGLHEQSWAVSGVSIDSRAVVPGDLFVALQGADCDGHDHVAAAFRSGATAAIVSRQPPQVPPDGPLVFVEDTFEALQALGRQGRVRAKAKIIAITGSVGKTGTKEMLDLSLSAVGCSYAAPSGLNKPCDLFLALANLPPDADYGIFEIGLTQGAELAALSLFVRPDIAVITAIEAVYPDLFASPEAVAEAKTEIFKGMGESGVVILNRANPHYTRLAAAAKKRGIKKIISFSDAGKADAVMIDYTPTETGRAVKASVAGCEISYLIGAPGEHHVINSLAALLASHVASGKVEECAAALSHYEPSKGRGFLQVVDLSAGGRFKLFDESANASPSSVRAAIRVLAETKPAGAGRRVLVLGDMRDLGPTAPDLHIELVPDIKAAGIDLVFCCGDRARYLFDALPPALRGAYALDSEELASFVTYAVRADDVVSVTGAKNMEMQRVVDALAESDTFHQPKAANM